MSIEMVTALSNLAAAYREALGLHAVAASGRYTDLTDIPANLGTLATATLGAKGMELLSSSTSALAIDALGGSGGQILDAMIAGMDAAKLTGTIDPARLPVIPSGEQVISSGDFSALTIPQQDAIGKGTLVTTTDGRRWIYTGAGSKTDAGSYIELSDTTPDWSVIANKPANITAIAALTSAADKAPYATGAGTWALMDVTVAGRALLGAADAPAQRTALSLGSMAVQDANNVAITGGTAALSYAIAEYAILSSSNPQLYLNKAVSGGIASINSQAAGILRWSLELGNSEAESGGNTGSNASLSHFSDAGSWLGFALQISRASGDITLGSGLKFTTFGGFPTLSTGSRLYVKKENATAGDYANFIVLRDTAGFSGGTPGTVNCAALVNVAVNSVVTSFEWGLLSQMTLNAAGGGEHCAFYSQGVKNANGTLWASCFEMRDNVPNPTTGSLGMEMGMFVKGGDSSGMRHGIDISIGSTDSLAGTNIVTSGIRIGPTSGDPARAQLVNGIEIKGRAVTGIDLSNLDTAYSDVSMKLPTNSKLRWKDGDGSGGATHAELAWNSVISTWQISGVDTATSATSGAASALPANPNRYITIQFNGDLLKVPAYNV